MLPSEIESTRHLEVWFENPFLHVFIVIVPTANHALIQRKICIWSCIETILSPEILHCFSWTTPIRFQCTLKVWPQIMREPKQNVNWFCFGRCDGTKSIFVFVRNLVVAFRWSFRLSSFGGRVCGKVLDSEITQRSCFHLLMSLALELTDFTARTTVRSKLVQSEIFYYSVWSTHELFLQ